MTPLRFRLQLLPLTRAVRTVVLLACLAAFLPGVMLGGGPTEWRVLSLAGVVSACWSLRFIWGAAVVVGPEGLRVQKWWPLRKDIPWYRVLSVEVVPGYWYLDLELNSGERVTLPCVERLDDLFDAVEHHRTDLDRVTT